VCAVRAILDAYNLAFFLFQELVWAVRTILVAYNHTFSYVRSWCA
jgi:hypothetical protein